jgi:hypothetical protein
MTAHFNSKAIQIIRDKIVSENKKITVVPGKCRWNYRCHMNAVHESIKHKHKKIAMVMYMYENGTPIIHFVNYKKGKFIDNTLGEWCVEYQYYLIKFIEKEDFFNVGDIFDKYRDHLQNCLTPLTKFFNNETF